MSERIIEQVIVGCIVALMTAIVNQALVGTIDIWWVAGGFVVAILCYALWQATASFPFIKYRVTKTQWDNPSGRELIFRGNHLTGKLVEGQLLQFIANTPDEREHDVAVVGPYLKESLHKGGKYRVRFRLKVDNVNVTNERIIEIDVASSINKWGEKRLAARMLTTHDFRKSDEFQVFILDFYTIQDEKDVEFRIFSFTSGRTITLDYIELSRRLL